MVRNPLTLAFFRRCDTWPWGSWPLPHQGRPLFYQDDWRKADKEVGSWGDGVVDVSQLSLSLSPSQVGFELRAPWRVLLG